MEKGKKKKKDTQKRNEKDERERRVKTPPLEGFFFLEFSLEREFLKAEKKRVLSVDNSKILIWLEMKPIIGG